MYKKFRALKAGTLITFNILHYSKEIREERGEKKQPLISFKDFFLEIVQFKQYYPLLTENLRKS